MTPSRPVVRYHGGKWLLAPWILSHMPPHRTYVEPFAGGASVLLRKERSHGEVYNDLDGEVVNVFRVLRDPTTAAELMRLLTLTPFARLEFEMSYDASDDPVEQARRTLLRSHAGFGSNALSGTRHATGFRSDSKRAGTTPALTWATLVDAVPAFIDRLRGVVIESKPALDLIRQHDYTEALFYVDPPYVHITRGNIAGVRQKYRHELTDDDHRELSDALHGVAGMVVLSGYPCELYDKELYADWLRFERDALADGARARTEVLWLNAAAAARLSGQTALSFDPSVGPTELGSRSSGAGAPA